MLAAVPRSNHRRADHSVADIEALPFRPEL